MGHRYHLLAYGLLAVFACSVVGCQGSDAVTPTLNVGDAAGAGGKNDAADTDSETPGPGADVSVAGDVPSGVTCAPDECTIDGVCYAAGDSDPNNPCQGCVPAQSLTEWTAVDGDPCEDGSACTLSDQCSGGACVGVLKSCGDGNPCTTDTCDPATAACGSTFNTARCDDADPCTVDDACFQGACKGGAPACDDHSPCTADACKDGICSHAPAAGACDDGDLCTTGDTCDAGACVAGSPTACDDGSVCTADSCAPATGCKHTSLATYCLDDNPCTDEACDAEFGCVYPPNAALCDDGSVCTKDDVCALGSCHGLAIEVSDGNPCTDDACDPILGVTNTPNTLPCEDGNLCTLGDTCANKNCDAGPDAPNCNDGELCTDDSCDPLTGCVKTPNTLPCDDSSVCTEADTCGNGACLGNRISCDDSNVCTTDSCDDVTGCAHALIVSNACRPDIIVTYPPRGATILGTSGNATVTVTGSVSSGAGPMQSLTLNGQPVTLGPDGTYSFPVLATMGGNTLVFDAVDALGGKRHRVQAFHWSTAYVAPVKGSPKSGMAPEALGIWLSKDALGKLTQVFQGLVAGIDIAGSIPNPLFSNGQYDVSMTNLTYGTPTISLEPIDGGLRIGLVIKTIKGNINAAGKKIGCVFGLCTYYPSASGTLTIDTLSATADVAITVTPEHTLAATVGTVSVTMSDPKVQLDGLIGALVSPIVNLIIPLFKGTIETSFQDVLKNAIGPLVADALNGFALAFDFNLPSLDPAGSPIAVNVDTDFQAVHFSPAGGELILRGGAYSDVKTPYSNLGVALRGTCGAPGYTIDLPDQSPLELALADDLINEVLYAGWRGGLLEFDVPPSLLGGVDLSAFGIGSIDVHVSAMLAPVVSDCVSGEPVVHIGDLRIDAGLDLFGSHMDVVMFVSLRTKIVFSLADGQLGFALSDIESVESDIAVVQENLVGSEATVAGLVNASLIPALVGSLGGGALASIPLPEIDVSGVKIAINPTALTRKPGETLVSGSLK